MPNPVIAPVVRFFGRLSYPRLFALTAALFLVDLAVPDVIPFADELLLGLGTLLLANWKDRRKTDDVIEGRSRR
jgi:hypothetical protein